MRITAILPYFGGKRTLAPKIVKVIGPHKAYFEPFCGSLAVLMAKEKCHLEVANDLNGDVVNLARVLADDTLGPSLYDRLQRTLVSEQIFKDYAGRWKARTDRTAGEKDLERAIEFFVGSWMGMNGVCGTRANNHNFCARYTSNGGSPGIRFVSAVDSVPMWHQRLREVTFLSKCGIEVCEKIEDKEGTAIYCDPPYIVKGADYLHDFEADDHMLLAGTLKRFKKTRVVVSYYDHPMLRELYPDFGVIDCRMVKSLVSQGMRDKTNKAVSPEVLLVNWKPEGLFA